jgi:hypothetical protein
MKNKYKFTVPDHGDQEFQFESTWDHEKNPDYSIWIVEEAAEYYHDNCDGYECGWPLIFELFTMDGKLLGKFEVEREAVPQFSATRK